jgi:hypothetical protein
MPRKAPAKKSQPTASKKEASNVKASSKNRRAKLKRSAPASKSKSSGNSIDALVKKQLTSLRQADTLFKDAVSIVEIYRKKHPELDQYIPSVEFTQREITVRGASSEDSNSHYRFHIESFRPDKNEVEAEHVGHWPSVPVVKTQSLPARDLWLHSLVVISSAISND